MRGRCSMRGCLSPPLPLPLTPDRDQPIGRAKDLGVDLSARAYPDQVRASDGFAKRISAKCFGKALDAGIAGRCHHLHGAVVDPSRSRIRILSFGSENCGGCGELSVTENPNLSERASGSTRDLCRQAGVIPGESRHFISFFRNPCYAGFSKPAPRSAAERRAA